MLPIAFIFVIIGQQLCVKMTKLRDLYIITVDKFVGFTFLSPYRNRIIFIQQKQKAFHRSIEILLNMYLYRKEWVLLVSCLYKRFSSKQGLWMQTSLKNQCPLLLVYDNLVNLQGCKLLSDIGHCPTKLGKCLSKSNFDRTLVRSKKKYCHIIATFFCCDKIRLQIHSICILQ